MMLADQIAYVALVSHDPAATASVFERHVRLPRRELSSAAGPGQVFALGRSALAVFPPGHPLMEGETRPGVHSIALGVASRHTEPMIFALRDPRMPQRCGISSPCMPPANHLLRA